VQTSQVDVKQVPAQQGIASLHASPSALQTSPAHVPLVAPSGMSQAPPQQSTSPVQAPPSWTQALSHVQLSTSQFPEQHWPCCVQERPFGTHATQRSPVPVPVSRQSSVQQAASFAQVVPVAPQAPVCTPQLKPVPLFASTMQAFGAQHLGSSASSQAAPFGVQLEAPAVQWRTPSASGTHGAPPQHWSLNWQTFAVVT
jgi:hypothetical protein